MTRRMTPTLLSPVAGTIVTVLSLISSPSAVYAQAQPTENPTALRTPWGDPDLQGLWNNATITPLQRPEALADQAFLSAEEIAAIERQVADRNEQLNAPSQVRTEALPAGGNVGAYNNFWMDRGTTVVGTRRTSLIVDPPNGRLPELTAAAEHALNSPAGRRLQDVRRGDLPADSWEQLDLGDRCLWYRGIPSFPTGYNNNYHIVQTPQFVAILQEHIHDVRFIPLDRRPHLTPSIRQFAGDSRGHWEGDTLVVETTNFNHHAFIRGFNGTLSEDLHVVERFSRRGPDTLDYEFKVADPKTWTRPWEGSLPMARTEGQMYEYACHEGNYGLTGILAGSRAQDKANAMATDQAK